MSGERGVSERRFRRDVLEKKKKRREKRLRSPLFKARVGAIIKGKVFSLRNDSAPFRPFGRFEASGGAAFDARPRFQSSWFQEERFEHI